MLSTWSVVVAAVKLVAEVLMPHVMPLLNVVPDIPQNVCPRPNADEPGTGKMYRAVEDKSDGAKADVESLTQR